LRKSEGIQLGNSRARTLKLERHMEHAVQHARIIIISIIYYYYYYLFFNADHGGRAV
jgi:hypothetical protein